MSIAKRLSLACAGVVVGALGFFSPRADAGMMIDLRVDPNPTNRSTFVYVLPTLNAATGHYELQGSQTSGNKFVLLDIVATVTGSQVNSSMPDRSAAGILIAGGGGATAMPYVPSFLAEGVSYAAGTVSLTGNTGLLDTNSAKFGGGTIAAGLVPGDRGLPNQSTTYTPNYNAQINGVNYSGVLKSQAAGVNGYIRSIGPITGDIDFNNPNSYINMNAISDARFNGGEFGADDGASAPAFPLMGDPTQASSTFIIGKVTLFFGTLGAQSSGTLNLNFIPVGDVSTSANSWMEDFITGLSKDGNGQLVDTGDGRGFYVTTGSRAPSQGGFSVGSGVMLDVIVPEPATLGLFAVGALIYGMRRNRRK